MASDDAELDRMRARELADEARRAESAAARRATPVPPRDVSGPFAHLRWVWATAAALVVASAALLMWGLSLRQDNARLMSELVKEMKSSHSLAEVTKRIDAQAAEIASMRARLDDALTPALNVPIVALLPTDAARGAPAPVVVRVPANARLVTFVVNLAAEPAAGSHELEIVGPAGTVLWRGPGLRPNAEKTFTVTVPRALLPAGTCRLRISVFQNGAHRVVGDYPITVES